MLNPMPFARTIASEHTDRRTYRTRNAARADVFDYVEQFYDATRHSTIGYFSPVEAAQ
jgi:putative transposase